MPEHEPSLSSDEAVATLTPDELAVEASLRELLTFPAPSPDFDARVLAAARQRAAEVRVPGLRVLRGGAGWFRGLSAAAALLLCAGVLLPATAPRQAAVAPSPDDPLGVSPLRGARVVSAAGALGHAGQPLALGSWVDTGEPLVVRPDGHLLLALPEGTELAFDGGTHATLRFDHRVRAIELRRGRLYADVIKVGSTSEGRPIVLRTPAGEARVLGTELTARASRAATRLTVRHGLVRLANHRGSAYVGAEETGLLTEARRPHTRRTSTVDRHFRWIGKLQPGGHHPAEKAFGGGPVGEDEPAIGSLVARDAHGQPVTLALAEQAFSATVQDGVAHTTVRFAFRNDSAQDLEGTFRFALPKAASISRYAVLKDGRWVEGRVVEREQARRIYAEQKRLMKEPALLEWASGSAFQAQVFPIEAQAVKQLEVSYVEELPERRGVSRLILPLVSEASRLMPPERLRVTCRLLGAEARAALRCPSHYAEAGWEGGARVIRLVADDLQPRNDFVLELARSTAPGLEARVDAGAAGEPSTVLLRVRPDLSWLGDDVAPSRVVFLADASRSQGGTLKEVQLELLEGLLEALPVRVRPRLFVHHVGLEELRSSGPDFDEGLLAALWHSEVGGASDPAAAFRVLGRALAPDAGVTLVYLGDGVATAGERDSAEIARAFREGLPPGAVRRLITVGVGADTDAALLEALAREREGVFVGVRPGDDLGLKVHEAVSALTEPVLTQVVVDLGQDVTAVAPAAPTNLRDGETLSLTAQLRSDVRRLPVSVTGVVAGRSFRLGGVVDLLAAAPGSQLSDLWARRRVADLLLEGATRRDDVLDLAIDHGIVTPYTSLVVLEEDEFARYQLADQNRRRQRDVARLAREAQDLAAAGDLEAAAQVAAELLQRAPEHRGGQQLLAELGRLKGGAAGEPDGRLAAQTRGLGRHEELVERYRQPLAQAADGEELPALALAEAWDGKPQGPPSSREEALAEGRVTAETERLGKLLEHAHERREVAEGQVARLSELRTELQDDLDDLRTALGRAAEKKRKAPGLAGPPVSDPAEAPPAPVTPVEKPIIILEEEVEVTEDLPRGTDLSNMSNKNLDESSVVDAYGVGGGSAGAYGNQWGRREGDELDGEKESRSRTTPTNGAPVGGNVYGRPAAAEDANVPGDRAQLDGFFAGKDSRAGRYDDANADLGDAKQEAAGGSLAAALPPVSELQEGLKTVASAQSLLREGDKAQDEDFDYGELRELKDAALVDGVLGSGTKQGYLVQPRSSTATTRGEPSYGWADRGLARSTRGSAAGEQAGTALAGGVDLRAALADAPVLNSLFRAFGSDESAERANRTKAANNLRQLGLAALSAPTTKGDRGFSTHTDASVVFYADAKRHLPSSEIVTRARPTLRDELVGLVRDLDAASVESRGSFFDSLSALCFQLEGEPSECAYLAHELLRYAPQDLDLHELLGRCFEALGRPLAAVRAFSGLVEAQPDDGRARLRYGLALERLGFHELALDAFEEAVALDEGLPGPRFALVRLAVRSGRLDLAEAQLQALLARNFDPAEHGDVASQAREGLRALYLRGAEAWPEQAERFALALQALEAGAYQRRAVRIHLILVEGAGELVVQAPGDPLLTPERPFAPSGGLVQGGGYDHVELRDGAWSVAVRAAEPVSGALVIVLHEGTPQETQRHMRFSAQGGAVLWEGELR
jgi:ferric-dicitrate binding protein FerR (iron transport regulator)/tetratricopeptide (TPR) repeat protein